MRGPKVEQQRFGTSGSESVLKLLSRGRKTYIGSFFVIEPGGGRTGEVGRRGTGAGAFATETEEDREKGGSGTVGKT